MRARCSDRQRKSSPPLGRLAAVHPLANLRFHEAVRNELLADLLDAAFGAAQHLDERVAVPVLAELVAVVDAILGGLFDISMAQLLGWGFSPLAWCLGVPWDEAQIVGSMLGKKLVLTELLAYLDLKQHIAAATPVLSQRSAIISSYALCGFANVASIGIQIGGLGAMVPERRGELARLGLKAMLAGALVSCISGALAGLLV